MLFNEFQSRTKFLFFYVQNGTEKKKLLIISKAHFYRIGHGQCELCGCYQQLDIKYVCVWVRPFFSSWFWFIPHTFSLYKYHLTIVQLFNVTHSFCLLNSIVFLRFSIFFFRLFPFRLNKWEAASLYIGAQKTNDQKCTLSPSTLLVNTNNLPFFDVVWYVFPLKNRQNV